MTLPSTAEVDEYNKPHLSTFSNNVAENGHLPPSPPPILGPMSHVQTRDTGYENGGNVQRVEVDIGAGQSSNLGGENGKKNLGMSNPTYEASDDLRKGESAL